MKQGLGIALWLAAFAAGAQAAEPPPVPAREAAIVDLDAMVVRGVQPGPGLWKVSKGEHVLWILGTVSPLPSDIEWKPDEVESAIAQSQQVLLSPALAFDADVGFFGRLALAPSALKAMKNEDDAELRDVLPPDLYARWQVQKQRYLGRDRGVERKRPMVAAGELYEAAAKKSGLGRKLLVGPVVERAAKAAGIKPTPTRLVLKIEDPRAAIKEFRAGGMDDVECFRSVLTAVERDLPTMVERANAWAMGDIEALRRLPREDPRGVCTRALSQSGFARGRGYGDLNEKLAQHWLALAEAALQKNGSTFALLPISELLAPQGYLARLQERGYVVEAP
ncbi:TraB/GumN family protein [[Pseudomonas] boreopolis]|uniref:TraB/GumN family protein n=1 Tax=Xanthomonas boreopolis TaxID=86183 RepID=UPI003D9AEC9A